MTAAANPAPATEAPAAEDALPETATTDAPADDAALDAAPPADGSANQTTDSPAPAATDDTTGAAAAQDQDAPAVDATPAAEDHVDAAPNGLTETTHVIEVPGPLQYFYDHHALAGMDTAVFIRWGIIVFVWLLAAVWHQYQNKAFYEYIRNTKARTKLNDRLSHLAYNRAFEVMGVFFALVLAMMFYDTRVFKAESDLETARNALAVQQKEFKTAKEDIATLRGELDSAFDRISSGLDDDKEEQLDNLKTRYENLFISYYYLKRCNALSKTDFHLLNSSLIQELTDLNARAGIRKRILEAAKGTHDELYANAPCTSEAIDPKKKEIEDYLRQVIDSLPDQ